MEYNSCFDIIGPIMVGPSSSHTAGVVSIGNFIYRKLKGIPERADVVFYGSFATTYRGHGTDKAIVGGLLGLTPDDSRIKESLNLAEAYGLAVSFSLQAECPFFNHPNTVLVKAHKQDRVLRVGGVSLGGGVSKIVLIDGETANILLDADAMEDNRKEDG